MPLRPTCCGLPTPLSETETAADLAPVALGLNFTLMKQLAPDATLVPQVLAWVKSAAFAPTIVTGVIAHRRVAFVAQCDCLGQARRVKWLVAETKPERSELHRTTDTR